jgi:hypothetical protein
MAASARRAPGRRQAPRVPAGHAWCRILLLRFAAAVHKKVIPPAFSASRSPLPQPLAAGGPGPARRETAKETPCGSFPAPFPLPPRAGCRILAADISGSHPLSSLEIA